jgi:hypothetical protein
MNAIDNPYNFVEMTKLIVYFDATEDPELFDVLSD